MSKSKIHEYNLLDTISIAVDVFKTQGYKKWEEDGKLPNKEVVKEKLKDMDKSKSLMPDYSTEIDYIFELKKDLVFKKLASTITDYESNVLEILEMKNVDVRHIGLIASLPLMAENIKKKEARTKKFEYYQENSRHVGTIGSVWNGAVTLIEKTVKQSQFGEFWIAVFVNEQKNIIKWLTQNEPKFEINEEYNVSAIVKDHKTTQWYGNETVVKNCKKQNATNN